VKRFLQRAFAAAFLASAAVAADAAGTPHCHSPFVGAVAVDAKTGNTILSSSPDAECYPASCTKLMTARLALKAVKSGKLALTDRLAQSALSAAEKPSHLGIPVGATVSVDDALKALMVQSANDVAVMFAERLGGSVGGFVAMMNAEAKSLGMTRTTYESPNGYPPRGKERGFDRSTAADLAKLARAMLLEQPEILKYTSIVRFSIPEVRARDGRPHEMRNHNNLLWRPGYMVKEVDGLKTGFHNAGGFSVVATAASGKNRVIVVVSGSPTWKERDARAGAMVRDALGSLTW